MDPLDSIADYGTDALRYALLTSSARGLGEIGFMYVHINMCQPCVQIDQGLRVGKILRRYKVGEVSTFESAPRCLEWMCQSARACLRMQRLQTQC